MISITRSFLPGVPRLSKPPQLSVRLSWRWPHQGLSRTGAGRMLYTAPNSTFINSAGEVVVNINDASGSITTLQTLIDNARR
jgi:hypothetical protein